MGLGVRGSDNGSYALGLRVIIMVLIYCHGLMKQASGTGAVGLGAIGPIRKALVVAVPARVT